DVVELFAACYRREGQWPCPVILRRSPYDRSQGGGVGTEAARRGYACLFQKPRGRFGSGGDNLPFVGDGWAGPQDGLDTVEWIAKQPWCDGKIGTYGGSALGITQLQLAGTGTQRVAAQEIQVGCPDFYQIVYRGGVFRKAMVE